MSDRSGCGDSSLASASGGSETQASPPEPEPNGPAVLDSVTQCLVPLGRGTADREAGHCGGLASRRIPVVLALAVSRAVAEPKSPSKSRSLSAGWYAPRRSRKAVTGFFAEPPRGHRRARLLHGADGQLPRVVLLVRIEHARRRTVHFHVTAHPNSDWVVQQLREAFPDSVPYRYAILDRDTKFDAGVWARCAPSV
jgi:hypothetical protein